VLLVVLSGGLYILFNASTGSDTGSLAATPLRWILLTLRLCSASGALAAWLEQPDPP